MRFRLVLVAIAVTAGLVFPTAATAHVTANPGELTAGFGYTEFRVGHGCEGSPTTRVSIEIPEGIASVSVGVVPGWQITTQEGTLAQPVSVHGEEVAEGVTQVTWEGGPLPEGRVLNFPLSFFASEELVGETIWFPAVQQCEEGEHRWIEIPVEGEEEPPEPAPGIALLAAETEEGAADEAAVEEEGAESGAAADASAAAASDGDDDSNATLALVFGIAGLAAGLIALGVALFRGPRRTAA